MAFFQVFEIKSGKAIPGVSPRSKAKAQEIADHENAIANNKRGAHLYEIKEV